MRVARRPSPPAGRFSGRTEAAVNLSESRGARATELTNGIADCLKHCDRMIVVVEGDLRASRAGL